MSKTRLTVLGAIVLSLTAFVAQAQLINPGFETWTNDFLAPTAMDPNSGTGTTGWWDYNFFNYSPLGSSPVSVLRSDTAHSGNYSARIQSVIYMPTSYSIAGPAGTPFIGHPYSDTLGILFNGNTNLSNQTYKPGIPCTDKITQFSFYYQYKPNGTDTAECRVLLVQKRNPVAGGRFKTSVATGVSGWQQAIINMTYVNSLTPDTLYVLFSSASLDVKPKPGSILWVDDVSMKLPTGINQAYSEMSRVEAYPNPACNSIIFHIQGQNQIQTLSIFELSGRLTDRIIIQNERTEVDLQKYRTGLYFYRLVDTADNLIRSGKFSVVRP